MPEPSNDFTLVARLLSDGFNRVEHRLDEINRRLDSKADNTRVAELEKRHAEYEERIEDRLNKQDERFKPLEAFMLTSNTTSLIKGKGLAFLSALALTIISALIYLALNGGAH